MLLAASTPPTRTQALDRMTQALEAAKHARDRGANVSEARAALKEARSAFERGDYARAKERTDYLLAQFGTDAASSPPPIMTTPSPPGALDLGAAAGRLAEAADAVKQARVRGFNVQVAKAALKQAKRAFKSKDYAATFQLASKAIELSGSTGRVRP